MAGAAGGVSSEAELETSVQAANIPMKTAEDQLGYLPEPPDEPLPSDCCGTGCTPCVMDIYQEELAAWRRLETMSPRERAEWRKAQLVGSGEVNKATSHPNVALSPVESQVFSVARVQQVTKDSFIFTFKLPDNHVLGSRIGQHIVLRYREKRMLVMNIIIPRARGMELG